MEEEKKVDVHDAFVCTKCGYKLTVDERAHYVSSKCTQCGGVLRKVVLLKLKEKDEE